MSNTFKINNFDLLRLIAALEVAISHSISHLKVNGLESLSYILHFIPGVPIFFFVSGFLISKSYENSSSLKEYSKNRILRIYPALIVVTIIGILSVYLTGYFSTVNVALHKIFIWFLAQTSIIQFYNPEFMRSFGVGVLNGSLWTISVELQFYILIPIIYKLFGLMKSHKKDYPIYILIFVSMLIHFIYYQYKPELKDTLLFKLIGITFIPWVYMFLIGMLFQRNFSSIYNFLNKKLFYIIVFYILTIVIINPRLGNGINPILFIILASLVFSLAYNFPNLSNKLLKGNDISYGIYIYHMLFVNLFIYYSLTAKIYYIPIIVLSAIVMGILSWIFIEKPFLKLKKKTIHNLNTIET